MRNAIRQTFASITFFVVCLLCFNNTGYAEKKDSLTRELRAHTQSDSTRVNMLNELASIYVQTNVDSMEQLAKEGLAIAENIHFNKGVAGSAYLLGIAGLRKHEYDHAIKYFEISLHAYEQIKHHPMQGEVLVYLGDIYYRDTKYGQALEYYNRAVKFCEETGDMRTEGLALIDIGGIYTEQGSYTEAIKYYLKGLKVFEKNNEIKGKSMTLVNIANVYSSMGNYKMAREYIDKSLPLTKNINDREVVFSNLVNIGVIYGQMKEYKKALASFEKGLLIADSMGDESWKNACLGDIADMYFQTGSYDTSLAKYSSLLKDNEQLKDTIFIITAKNGIGSNLVKMGRVKEGINVLLQTLELARIKQLKQTIFDVSLALSDAYEQLRDFPSALKYHKIYYSYRDSLASEKNEKHIQQLQFDYQLEKKEAQIELLNKNKIIVQDKNDRQRIIIWGALSGLVLVMVICAILYRSHSQEKRNKKVLLKRKEEIKKQALRLKELNDFKDKTFSVLSHDLRGPLGALTAAMSMLDEQAMTPEDFMQVKPEVQRQLVALNILMDNLLNWAKGHMQGDQNVMHGPISIAAIVEQNINLTQEFAAAKNITFENNVPRSATAIGDAAQIDIVIRNLVMNAIKFSNNNRSIAFAAIQTNGTIQIAITDEGVGMTQEQINKLFSTTEHNSTYGTGGEKGVGLGLLLCFDFVKANNGTITAKSEPGKGTTFTIMLPAPLHIS